jgi:uncharacterized GH25 family protein
MKRLLLSLLLVTAAALPVRAHFIWVLPPDDKDKKTARVVFSDTPRPDDAELLKKITKAEAFARGADGKTVALKHAEGKQSLGVAAPDDKPYAIGVVLQYGVTQRGDDPAFLLNYYAKGYTGLNRGKPDQDFIINIVDKPWEKLPLEIIPPVGSKRQAQIFWQGKPTGDVEVTLYLPGQEKSVELKTDKDGSFRLEDPKVGGLYGIRARYVEKREGEFDGKKYKEIRHYATFAFPIEVSGPSNEELPDPGNAKLKPAADPAATKLLADARAARANWDNFPGFTADVEVNLDGTITKGKVKVDAKGKVDLDMAEGEAAKWAKGQLDSIVGHRISDGDLDTPCAFADDVKDHPMGRAIQVLNDENHSSYRIKDRQVIEVNRRTGPVKFTISVMENRQNEEKKYLPVSYVVNTWDAASGALKSSATFHQEWKRVGKFDLPANLTVVTATGGKLEARGITLTNQKLQ